MATISPTVASPDVTVNEPESVTSPITAKPVCHFSQISPTRSARSGSTIASIRSWDSETMISKGSIPASRRGTRSTSISIPTRPAEAISPAEEVSPAAPRSCRETSRPSASSSWQHSSSLDSSNGSPIWTVGRLPSSSSSSSAEASTEAPPIPSLPVSEPIRTTRLPGPEAAALTISSVLASPTHIALTRGFWA